MFVRLLCCALVMALSACSNTQPRVVSPVPDKQFLLLGEVHDNPQAHARRLALLQALIAAGKRPAIAMEQFDREQQPALDRAMQHCPDAACVVREAAAPNAAWAWHHYHPVIALALQHRLPLLAANLSRQDAGRIMREGLGAGLDAATLTRFGLDQALPEALLAQQRRIIALAHCDAMPDSLLPGMAQAQLARDVWMARVLLDSPALQTLLLAGNGHVRRDIGVPYWLGADAARAWVAGFAEASSEATAYDALEIVAAPPGRGDPCAALRARAGTRQ